MKKKEKTIEVKSEEKIEENLELKESCAPEKPPKRGGLRKWLKIALFSLFIVAVAVAGFTAYSRYFIKADLPEINVIGNIEDNLKVKETEKPKLVVSKLDGTQVTEAQNDLHPLAVMVENHPDARPQSGLDQASIIYEAIAEGGITRFMAIFGPGSAQKVGPVRSARTYYLDWALEYDAYYSHVGGNLDALQLIPKIGIKDLDQFRYGTQAYWREPAAGKATEHTMYTDTHKLRQIGNDKWGEVSNYTPIEYKEELSLENRPESQKITIDFSSASYKVDWQYDKEKNIYLRSLAGAPHKDAVSGNQLTAKNVIVQEVLRSPVVTEINENGWAMKTVGSGKAQIFINGKKIDATWKKDSREKRTEFFDPESNKIKFNPGITWFEIVPPGTAVNIM